MGIWYAFPSVIPLYFSLNTDVVADVVSEGKLNGAAYLPGQSQPIYVQDGRYTCDDIHMYVKDLCPFIKNSKYFVTL